MRDSSKPVLAIFDHDGVLVDSLAHHIDAWLELGRRTGLPFTEAFVHETFGMTNPNIFRRMLGDALSNADAARMSDDKEACYRELAKPHLALMPGVRQLLDALSAAGILLAVGSSAPRANLELTIACCGLTGRFASLAALEDIKNGKPDPEVFLLAAERAGIEPRRCVVFEDALVGVQAAKAAGMRAVGVGSCKPLEALRSVGADRVVPALDGIDVAEFVAWVRESGTSVCDAGGAGGGAL